MPEHPAKIERERGWWVGIAGLTLLVAWLARRVIEDSSTPDGYGAGHDDRSLWRYPTDEVRRWVGAMLVECTLACFVLALRSRVSMGARALLVAGLMFMGGIAMAPFAMDANPAVGGHLQWLLAGTVWMVMFGAARSFAARLRDRDAP